MEEKRSLILDIDGTLWDTRPLLARAWNGAIEEDGRSIARVTEESLRGLLGKTLAAIGRELFSDVPPEEADEIMELCLVAEHKALEADPCHVTYPKVVETIRAMAKERKIFIVSNCETGYVQLFLEKTRLENEIADAEWFGRTGAPKGESIRRLMERNGLRDALYVGDTQGDLEATRYAGISFVWASYGFGNPETWDYKIDCFSELQRLP